MNLVESMVALRDRLTDLPVGMGVPQYRSVKVFRLVDTALVSFEINPIPKVETVSKAQIKALSGDSNIRVANDYLIVTISRSFDFGKIYDANFTHLEIDNQQFVPVHLENNHTTYRKLLVMRMYD